VTPPDREHPAKALRRFAQTGAARGVAAVSVDKLRNMLSYIDAIASMDLEDYH
jgi:hypothetical protein